MFYVVEVEWLINGNIATPNFKLAMTYYSNLSY